MEAAPATAAVIDSRESEPDNEIREFEEEEKMAAAAVNDSQGRMLLCPTTAAAFFDDRGESESNNEIRKYRPKSKMAAAAVNDSQGYKLLTIHGRMLLCPTTAADPASSDDSGESSSDNEKSERIVYSPKRKMAAAAVNDSREVESVPIQCYIHRVPLIIRRVNEEAYTPQLISIGPLHHGKPELANMENKKNEYKESFLKRITPEKIRKMRSFISKNKRQIHSCYAETFMPQSNKFVTMILHDSFFIIEIFLRRYLKISDMLLATLPLDITLCRDLQLFENQLPYFVLKKIYKLAFNGINMPTFVELSCHFFKKFEGLELSENFFQKTPKHFTDWKRITLLENYQRPKEGNGRVIDLPCAMKLNESGVQFKHTDIEGNNLFDIKFKKSRHLIPLFEVHELQIPRLLVNDETERQLRNIIALEQCFYPNDTLVCCYVDLMDYLINTEEDVDLLVGNKIISNHMGDNASVATMFNKLNQNVSLNRSPYHSICEQLKGHYNNPCNRARATLKRVYFNNPWRGTATVAATILLLLTIVQTIISILQVV